MLVTYDICCNIIATWYIVWMNGSLSCFADEEYLKLVLIQNAYDTFCLQHCDWCLLQAHWWKCHYSDHNKLDGISNHQRLGRLNCLFWHRSKIRSKLCITHICEGNPSVTCKFPSQRASYVGNVSIWWRHHGSGPYMCRNIPWNVSAMYIACYNVIQVQTLLTTFHPSPGASPRSNCQVIEFASMGKNFWRRIYIGQIQLCLLATRVFKYCDWSKKEDAFITSQDLCAQHYSDIIMSVMASEITSNYCHLSCLLNHLFRLGWVGLCGFLWWAPSAKRKDHHGVSSGWSSV